MLLLALLPVFLIATIFLSIQNHRLRHELTEAHINDNFGCLNRVGGKKAANRLIKTIPATSLTLLCIDVAGMGNRNSEIGEAAVNSAIAKCLFSIRMREKPSLVAQINSGDEFALVFETLICKRDIPGLCDRIDWYFKEAGFEGAYAAVIQMNRREDFMVQAQKGMNQIYSQKKLKVFA